MNLDIVTLNIAYPPDYGGMIDTFYRIRALHDSGIKIHLHCFEYGRKHSKVLESLCETTNYYFRETGILRQFSKIPYIVFSRQSETLLNNLIKNDYPILFDGLHSTYYIDHPKISNRKKLVRLHNIEHKYYQALAKNETNLLKKFYFQLESFKLKDYERVLSNADYILPISESDHEYFSSEFNNSVYLSPFHPFYELKSLPGIGDYIIYHGDMSVTENSVVADSLILNVFSKIPYQCIIAGKDPPEFIKKHAFRFPNIKVISDPDNELMERLIVNAQINILPALSVNGFKLKLLMALYAGRHCIVNSVVVVNSSIGALCHIAESNEDMIVNIQQLMKKPFTRELIRERQKIFSDKFDIRTNTGKLIKLVFGDV
jgi:hypothetical protein